MPRELKVLTHLLTHSLTHLTTYSLKGYNTFVSADTVMKKKEREMYDSFAQIINKYLYQSSISVNITSSSSLQLSMVELNSLPGVTVGDVILIEGTHSLTHSLTYSLTLTHSLRYHCAS